MAVYDVAVITTITNALGAVENVLTTQVDEGTSGSIMEGLVTARQTAFDEGMTLNELPFDYVRDLVQGLRKAETDASDTLLSVLDLALLTLDGYFGAALGTNMRTYYDGSDAAHTVTWDDAFRTAWRRVLGQELILQLAQATKSSGSWTTSVTTPGIELPVGLEVRTDSNIGVLGLTVTLGLTDHNGNDVEVGVWVEGDTPDGTVFQVTSDASSTFTDVRTISVSGGQNGDSVSVWVSV
ncbi:MAG: hypothetical protein JSS66_06955 [Armatimonadetes bacterium]|nr:hypothetical protein [Armatimonadota bacterium]